MIDLCRTNYKIIKKGAGENGYKFLLPRESDCDKMSILNEPGMNFQYPRSVHGHLWL